MINRLKTYKTQPNEEGFTLLELMIVVVILGILAAIAIPIFTNQQKAALDAQNKSHVRQVQQAVEIARVKTGQTLLQITGTNCTFCNFNQTTADPLTLPKTHSGWTTYYRSLDKISEASGMDVRNLTDAYGRPIFIDENEGENGNCGKDLIATYKNDYAYNNRENEVRLSFVSPTCYKLN